MTRNFCIAILAPLVLLLLGANKDERPRLTFQGLGDIYIGMTIAQLRAKSFTSDSMYEGQPPEEYNSCHYMTNGRDYPGVGIMINDGHLVRIDIDRGRDHTPPESDGAYKPIPAPVWKSFSGAKIGMSERDVKAIYGDWIKTSGHPYLGEAGSYLRLDSSDGKYAMIFETAVKDMDAEALKSPNQEKYVTDFRAGLTDAVGFIEGCA